MITIKPKTMIQPNELRIGDIFYFKGELTAITHTHLYEFIKGNVHLVPVELTPDILEAAGCVYIDEIGAYYINGHSLFEFIDGIKFNIFSANDSDCYIRIKYLHQLQNLYWCLCGQELQIDLTKLNKDK